MTKLRITVTKEILDRSKYCGEPGFGDISAFENHSSNCAIALAIRDVFPKAFVETEYIFIDEISYKKFPMPGDIKLPAEATDFINTFDLLDPAGRSLLPELTFEISIPDEIINQINIDELKPLLENHPTLAILS